MSLEVLDVRGGEDETRYGGQDKRHKFTGGIPSAWGALTNLKELKMPNSGLDGKRSAPVLSSIRTRAYFTLLCAGPIPVELFDLVNLKELGLSYNKLTGERSAPGLSGFIVC